ncbi:MAG: DUF167 domain-containing protein [Planctomycetia bacterium]|nr:DUF167 domain-containing protein [Planctomycetia bacterium]
MKMCKPTIPPAKAPPGKPDSPVGEHPPLAACGRWEGANLILTIKVRPRGGKFQTGGVVGTVWRVTVASPPEDGRATEELLSELAVVFGVRPGAVVLRRGAFTVQKVIQIINPRLLPREILR